MRITRITPLDWLLDNAGPIARNASDAAIALSERAKADSLDPRTNFAVDSGQRAPNHTTLRGDALKGRRFGVPAFVLSGDGVPFHDIPWSVSDAAAEKLRDAARMLMQPQMRAMFMRSLDALRRAGAEIVITNDVLPTSFGIGISIGVGCVWAQVPYLASPGYGATVHQPPHWCAGACRSACGPGGRPGTGRDSAEAAVGRSRTPNGPAGAGRRRVNRRKCRGD